MGDDWEMFEVDEYNGRMLQKAEEPQQQMFGFVPWTKEIEYGHRFLAIVAVIFLVTLFCCGGQ